MGKLRIGTSGWMYKDWGKKFYPKDLKKGHLQFYAGEFDTVELNSSFYHLPPARTFKKWRDETPRDFLFAVKLSQYITHRKKLQGVRRELRRFVKNASELGGKLGPILVQLPPWLRFDEKVLKKFLADIDSLTTSARFALEPRHHSWVDQRSVVVPLLKAARVALVFPHSKKIPSYAPKSENVTADFVYIRFHGPSEFAASSYGKKELLPWAERIAHWQAEKIDVFVYFNNDAHGHAIDDARTLARMST